MFRKRIIIFLAFVLILTVLSNSSSAALFKSQTQWHEYKSEHFIIFYRPDISSDYVKGFARNCERYYHTITERLGFSRFNFWLWENRAQVFIYKDKEDYLNNTNQPGWSQAATHARKKRIDTYYFEKDFFESVLAHELAHIVFREFVDTNTRVPLWFEEGIACANEQNVQHYIALTRGLAEDGTYTSVAQFERENVWNISDPESFYPISASLAIFLLEDYGGDYFGRLCRELRDGSSFYRALDKVYGIKNPQELDKKFLEFLR